MPPSWHVEAQFTALRYFALDGTDHASHEEQGSMIRRYIIWRNNHAYDERLRRIIDRANVGLRDCQLKGVTSVSFVTCVPR